MSALDRCLRWFDPSEVATTFSHCEDCDGELGPTDGFCPDCGGGARDVERSAQYIHWGRYH